jgi:hypothetical protein
MKDYYLFPKCGHPVKIYEKKHLGFVLELESNRGNSVIFEKESLIKELQDLLAYIKKYGNDNGV